MASPTGPETAARCRSANRASASLMADWAERNSARGSVIVERLDAEGAVRELRELLHARLGFGQRDGGIAQAGHALLEQRQRRGQLEGLALELRDDVLQTRESLLDRRH